MEREAVSLQKFYSLSKQKLSKTHPLQLQIPSLSNHPLIPTSTSSISKPPTYLQISELESEFEKVPFGKAQQCRFLRSQQDLKAKMMEKMQAGDAADGSVPGWGGCELGGLDDWMVGVWGGSWMVGKMLEGLGAGCAGNGD